MSNTKSAASLSRGTIVLVPFPFTDLSGNKVRPALVVSVDNARGADVVVLFISSKIALSNKKEDIKISDSTATGLKMPSVIKCRKFATLDKVIVLGELGKISPLIMKQVDANIRQMLGV